MEAPRTAIKSQSVVARTFPHCRGRTFLAPRSSNSTSLRVHTPDYKPSSSRVAEVALRHRMSRGLVYGEIKKGRLKARKCGNATIITGEDEAEWLARCG